MLSFLYIKAVLGNKIFLFLVFLVTERSISVGCEGFPLRNLITQVFEQILISRAENDVTGQLTDDVSAGVTSLSGSTSTSHL